MASLDQLADGRLIIGVGAGYLEPELTALGVPMAERARRTEEYLSAIEALWTQPGPVEFDGDLTHFAGIDAHPRPVQTPTPPIVIGGHSRAALSRATRRGNGWYGYRLRTQEVADTLAALDTMSQTRPSHLGDLDINVTPRDAVTPELLAELADLGVNRVIVSVGNESPDDAKTTIETAAAARELAWPSRITNT